MKRIILSRINLSLISVLFGVLGLSRVLFALPIEERPIPADDEYIDPQQDYSPIDARGPVEEPIRDNPYPNSHPSNTGRAVYESDVPYREAVDDSPSMPSVASPGSKSAPAAGVSNNWETLSQIESLQREVQQLRGLIEEMHFRLEQVSKQQKEQYLDLDRRVGELKSAPSTAANIAPSDASADVQKEQFASEEDAYRDIQKLIREKKIAEADKALVAFLKQFPNGNLTANAHYWLGEVALSGKKPDLAKAKKHFQIVLDEYPSHTKLPVAMYKLATVQDELGDRAKARALLESVIKKFPGTPSANMAKKYLAEIKK
jgi:tol-pal system protein YbgF